MNYFVSSGFYNIDKDYIVFQSVEEANKWYLENKHLFITDTKLHIKNNSIQPIIDRIANETGLA